MESRAICSSTVDPRELIYLIVPPVVQGIFYGVYLILFGLSIHIFRKRQLSRGHKSIFLGTVLLFLCCTFQCVIGSFPGGASTITGYGVIDWFPLVTNALYVITNLIANSLFAYRCYVIWGRKKHILWLPSLLILAETGFGSYWCISMMPFGDSFDEIDGFDTRTPLIFTLATNVALTGLSAGRIWWISRELRILGPKVARKYNTIIALIVESGSIYCIVIAAYLISIQNKFEFGGFGVTTSEIVVKTFFVILTQVVGIVPTLMVVQISLGVSTEDAQTILTSRIRIGQGEDGTRGIFTQPAMQQAHPIS